MATGRQLYLAIALACACGDDHRKQPAHADALTVPFDGTEVDMPATDGSPSDAISDATTADANPLFVCDGPEDCGNNQSCCYTTTPVPAALCRNNCIGEPVCHESTDCSGTTPLCCSNGSSKVCMSSCTLP